MRHGGFDNAHVPGASRTHDDGGGEHAAAGHKADERRKFGFIGAFENLQYGALFGIGHHVGRVIGRYPSALRHQLMDLVGSALGLHDPDVERQCIERQEAIDDLLDPAEPRIEDAAVALAERAVRIVEECQAGGEIGLGDHLLDHIVREIRPSRQRDLSGCIADARDRAHLPRIERRC